MNTYISVILENKERKLFLQKREEKKDIWYPGYWGLFGGKVESGESKGQACKREMLEELNLTIGKAIIIKEYEFENGRLDVLSKVDRFIEKEEVTLSEGLSYQLFSYSSVFNLRKLVPYDRTMIQDYLRNFT